VNFIRQGLQKFKHYRQTDRQIDRRHRTDRRTNAQTGITENVTATHSRVVNTEKLIYNLNY